MPTVRDILEKKGREVVTIVPTVTVQEAAGIMVERRFGALPVVATDGRVIGILSERDIVVRLVAAGGDPAVTEVRQVMTEVVQSVDSEAEVADCLKKCTDKRHRHLPVIEEDRLVGLVSIGDLVKEQLADQRFAIDQLGSYITGVPATDRIEPAS